MSSHSVRATGREATFRLVNSRAPLISRQQPEVGVAVAQEGVRSGLGELAAGAAFPAGVDGLPHPVAVGKGQALREDLAKPAALTLDDLE